MADRSLTVDDRTHASNPGAVTVSRWRWARFYPTWPLILTLLLAFSIFAVVRLSLWYLFLLLPVLGWNYLYWVRIKEFFLKGDANPGMVLQLNPTLVAVATDLTQGTGSYPAIKVIRTRLTRTLGQPLQPGTCLPTVALYSRPLDKNLRHWGDFDPRPLECATGDPQVIERVMASFTEQNWQLLRTALKQLPRKEPGLYLLEAPPESDHTGTLFVFAKIADPIGPVARGTRYEDPLNQDLQAGGWGRITGGGTMLNKDGTIQWLGLDIELVRAEGAVEFVRQRLCELGVPEGSVLEYKENGQLVTVPIHAG